jgi:hypothetical protein
VPREISVSIVAAPWRRLVQAARWNGKPAQSTTGVASTSETHCQPWNWIAGIIDSATTGIASATATTSRSRSRSDRSGSPGSGIVAV